MPTRQADPAFEPVAPLAHPSATAQIWDDTFRPRHLMHHPCPPTTAALLLGGLTTALLLPHGAASAAEGGPPPAAPTPAASAPVPLPTLPAETRLVLRLHDHARASNRWADGPYGTLLATAWGERLKAQATGTPGLFQLLERLSVTRSALLGITIEDQRPVGHLSGILPAGTTFLLPGSTVGGTPPAVTATIPLQPYRLDQTLSRGGPGFNGGPRFRWDELLPLPLPPASLTTTAAPEADAEATWMATVPGYLPTMRIAAAWTFTPYGLRERILLHNLPAVAPNAPSATLDRKVLAGLPPTTMWAVATAALPALAERLPGFATDRFDTWAADNGLPAWSTVRGSLGGALLWGEEGAPFPGLTLSVQMPDELGRIALSLLNAKVGFVAGDDGIHLGALGFIPIQAAWRDGYLYLTTANRGIAGASNRQGGFLGVPEIASAERELQLGPKPTGELLALGFSRSASSWNAVAGIASWFTRRTPALSTLATDLKTAGKIGFFALRRDPDGATLDAGGLLGGPLSSSQILSGFFRAFMTAGRPPTGPGDHGRSDGPPPAEPAPAETPPQVEF